VVDDEIGVLESLADLLRKEFHVLATSDPDQALKVLETEDVAVVLTDQRMPKLTGSELLVKALNLSPTTVRVLLTGYADIEVVIQAVNESKAFYYLTKPWSNAQILDLVRSAVRTHALAGEERKLVKELSLAGNAIALTALRSDLARDHQETLSRDVSELRAAVAAAWSTVSRLKKIEQRVPVCISCGKMRAPDATWHDLVKYLRETSRTVSEAVCPECAADPRASPGLAVKEKSGSV
jgi:response regulator RpfG family c-di-GMP phosphodiesterase